MSRAGRLREHGRIDFIGKSDSDIWFVHFDGEMGTQSFESHALPDGSPEDRAFRDELAALFGVRWIHDAVGRPCYALRCFDEQHEPIEGFEVDGRRWFYTNLLRRFRPGLADSRLAVRQRACVENISWARRRIVEMEELYPRLRAEYVDWEVEP